MDTPTSQVSTSPWRAGAQASEIDFGSVYFQPNRLDVLIHLLAFEQLAGEQPTTQRTQNWVSISDEFATRDNEPTVATLVAELMTSPDASLDVTFASGGQLVRGASAAAVAIASGRPCTRHEGADKVLDRSVSGLATLGWSTAQLRELLIEWARRDTIAAVVLVDLDAEGSSDAIHEIACRFSVVHDELQYVSADDADRLGMPNCGSTQLICVRGGDSLDDILVRHSDSIRLCISGAPASTALASLWRPDRSAAVSPAHTQRIRRMRRRQVADQLLERALGR